MKKFRFIFPALCSTLIAMGLLASCGSTNPANNKDTTKNDSSSCVHQYESVVTEPTADSEGYTTHTCKLCGHSYVDSKTDKLSSISVQYDDYVTVIGDIAAEGAAVSGDAIEIVTDNGTTYFHAKNIGAATITSGSKSVSVQVVKAKINIVVVMGQSNSCDGLFDNLTSDIACPIGTAYWFGNGQGAEAKEPVSYTKPSASFHSSLLAELYAQSVKAGDPVKNVLVWDNLVTSRSGQSITWWASSGTNNDGTVPSMTMLRNCKSYYENNSDKFEVVNCGIYWLQGEYDGSTLTANHEAMSPEKYTECFLSMWNGMKSAGAEYVAFFRVRGDIAENQIPDSSSPEHNDLAYNTALAAQLEMVRKYPEFFMATTLTENWVGTASEEHSVEITNYITFMNYYSGGLVFEDDLGNIATYKSGSLITSMKELFGSNNFCHYGKFGYSLIGADAAYNMYKALNGNSFAIVKADTSGSAKGQQTSEPGKTVSLRIAGKTDDIVFRPSCDSVAGVMSITVISGDADITNDVMITEGAHLGSISIENLRNYENVVITVTYTPVNGDAGSVTYNVVK